MNKIIIILIWAGMGQYPANHDSTIQSRDIESDVIISPNPNDGHFNINTSDLYLVHLQVFNSQGQLVWKPEYLNNSAEGCMSIDISSLASGLYYVHILTGQGEVFKKMMKH